jgi:hypothetical protein
MSKDLKSYLYFIFDILNTSLMTWLRNGFTFPSTKFNNSLIYFLFLLYCPDSDLSLSLKYFGNYRYQCTGNGDLIPALNIFGLPITGNGRNSIMVALANWLITPRFLQLEKLSSQSFLLAVLIAAILRHVWVITCLTGSCMDFPGPIVHEEELELGSMSTQKYGLLRTMDPSTRQLIRW